MSEILKKGNFFQGPEEDTWVIDMMLLLLLLFLLSGSINLFKNAISTCAYFSKMSSLFNISKKLLSTKS